MARRGMRRSTIVKDVETVARYDSFEAYVAESVAAIEGYSGNNHYARESFDHARGEYWDLGVTGRRASELALTGDPTITARTTDAVNRLESVVRDVPRSTYRRDFAGVRVDVPAYLGGNPMCMRRKSRTDVQTRHMAIYVCVSCQGAVTASDMLARGATILGLVESLQSMSIGVDLYLIVEAANGAADHFQVIRLAESSRPVDVSLVSFAIAHPAFARNLCYKSVASYANYTGQWSEAATSLRKGSSRWEAHVREAIGIAPSDVYVGYALGGDPTISNPDAWIAGHLSQVTDGAE